MANLYVDIIANPMMDLQMDILVNPLKDLQVNILENLLLALEANFLVEFQMDPPMNLLANPPSGPHVGPYPSGGLPYGGTPPMGTWTRHPWRPWVPTWYPTLISPTPNAHIMRKSLPYLIYTTGINPNAHARVFWKVI